MSIQRYAPTPPAPFPRTYGRETNTPLKVGRVVNVNPAAFTADVLVLGEGLQTSVPLSGVYGAGHGTDLTFTGNLRGALVLLVNVQGHYHVLTSLSEQLKGSDPALVVPALAAGYGGDNAQTYGASVERDFSGKRATDLFPGDKVIRADSGAEVGLMAGGIAKLKASPLAQIVLGKFKDFCKVVARRFHLWTDFGEINIGQGASGRVGVHLAGGADFAAETHPGKAVWTIQAWLGDCPDNQNSRLYLRVNDAAGAEYVTLKFDIGGNAAVATSKDVTAAIGQDHTTEITRDSKVTISGDSTVEVHGDAATTVLGDSAHNTLGDGASTVSGNQTMTTVGTLTISCSSDVKVVGTSSVTVTSGGLVRVQGHPVRIN